MREIILLISGMIKPTPGQPVNIGQAIENNKIAKKNGSKIIMATLIIEKQLDDVILQYFFRDAKENMTFFKNNILSANWFSLEAKRKLLLALINEKKLLKGKVKASFERESSKIINYRNAFSHGNIVERSDGTFIEYFMGIPKKDKLDDKYWDLVEKSFDQVMSLIKIINDTFD